MRARKSPLAWLGALGLLVCLLSPNRALATIYVVAHDPQTGAIGVAYSSSGGHFWQTKVKDRGLIGAGAYGLCPEATPETFLAQGLSASTIAKRLFEQCESVGWDSYRLAIVTRDGAISTFIAKRGCSVENPECGERVSRDVAVVGGGLRPGVLDSGINAFTALDPKIPLPCRLFKTLEAIYRAGGEKKPFRGASITVDDPTRPALLDWQAREGNLLRGLQSLISKEGYECL